MRLVIIIVCAAGWLAVATLALADYYKYTDDAGTVCITNKLANVPDKYRKRMKIVREATLSAKDTKPNAPEAVPTQAAPAAEQEAAAPPPKPGSDERRLPWLKLLGFVAASVAGLYGVTKAAGTLASPLLARVIYLLFFCGIFLFAYKSYADSLVSGYFSIKEKVLGMFEKSNVRQSSELEDGGKKQEEGK